MGGLEEKYYENLNTELTSSGTKERIWMGESFKQHKHWFSGNLITDEVERVVNKSNEKENLFIDQNL